LVPGRFLALILAEMDEAPEFGKKNPRKSL
jgi:hypothetical protein